MPSVNLRISKKVIVLALLLVSLGKLHAQENNIFYWNVGNFNINYDIVHNEWGFLSNIMEADWFFGRNFYIGLSALRISYEESGRWYTLLPLEVVLQIRPFKSDLFKLAIYDRIEWQYRHLRQIFTSSSRFYNSVGIKMMLSATSEDMRYNCNFATLFMEYTTEKEWKVGFTVDAAVCLVFIGWAIINK